MSMHDNFPMPGKRILLAGTGGQGVITAAKLLSEFFVDRDHQVVSGQLHGMAQRGGAVQSSVLIDCGNSPIIPIGGADIVIGFEPVETVRALPFISNNTVVIMNTASVVPFVLSQQFVLKKGDGKYPELEALQNSVTAVTQNVFIVPATELAEKAGAVKSVNIIMLGCVFGSGLLSYTPEDFLQYVKDKAPPHIAEANNKTFRIGVDIGAKLHITEAASWH